MTLMISPSGIRGLVGRTMTTELARDLGLAFAAWLDGGTVLVARDSRASGAELADAVVAGLTAGGCDAIRLGLATTPGTGLLVRRLGATGGVVLTASHNPVEWNGIKFLDRTGAAPSPHDAHAIIDRFQSRRFAPVAADQRGIVSANADCDAVHVETVLGLLPVDRIAARRFTVVLDSINGAGCKSGRTLLEALGCRVVQLNGTPDGNFAHRPEPVAENLTGLSAQVRAAGAAVGFAQDPDADRLAAVDETGRFFGEEYSLALAAECTFRHRPGAVATNLSTSRMIDDVAARHGSLCTVHRSPVGEAHVVEAMRRHNCVLGGEGNGGVIDPRVVFIRDSLISMGLILQLMSEDGRPLSQIVDALPRYAMLKQKLALPAERIHEVLRRFREAAAGQRVDDRDGVRVDLPDGWVLARASNTEPIIRLVAEAQTPERAAELIDSVRRAAGDLLPPDAPAQ